MRARRITVAICLLAVSLLQSSCVLVTSSVHNLVAGTTRCLDDHRERSRNKDWARAAWNELAAANPGVAGEDYGAGFQEGFADYLYNGGEGEPPPLPPARYRRPRYQTPQGYLAIEQWFAGYRAGVSIAREGGHREWITGPSSLRSTSSLPTPVVVSEFTGEPQVVPKPNNPPAAAPAAPDELLPPPAGIAPQPEPRQAPGPTAQRHELPARRGETPELPGASEPQANAQPIHLPHPAPMIESPWHVTMQSPPVAAPQAGPRVRPGPEADTRGVYHKPRWRPWPWPGGKS